MRIYSFPPTQPQRWKDSLFVCLGENPAQTSVFSNPLIFKSKNTKGLYVTSRISTHDLLEDRNNHWQGLQRNLCFLLKFRQPCLLSAKIWTTSCVIIYKIVQKCANFIFAALSGTFKLVINFLVKNMRKDIKKISLEMKRALKWVSFWGFFFVVAKLSPTTNLLRSSQTQLQIVLSLFGNVWKFWSQYQFWHFWKSTLKLDQWYAHYLFDISLTGKSYPLSSSRELIAI